MKKKCSNCSLVNFPDALACARCEAALIETISIEEAKPSKGRRVVLRIITFAAVCLALIIGFYFSLVLTAKPLTGDQKHSVRNAIGLLKNRGFTSQAYLLENLSVFRSSDNWLNASVAKENAYAATNFPFEIMTLYADFFTYPVDDTERAAILLHEAEHLKGKNEQDAYAFVWAHRKQLGWTKEAYFSSPVWRNIRKQTQDNVPELFTCAEREFGDCTE